MLQRRDCILQHYAGTYAVTALQNPSRNSSTKTSQSRTLAARHESGPTATSGDSLCWKLGSALSVLAEVDGGSECGTNRWLMKRGQDMVDANACCRRARITIVPAAVPSQVFSLIRIYVRKIRIPLPAVLEPQPLTLLPATHEKRFTHGLEMPHSLAARETALGTIEAVR